MLVVVMLSTGLYHPQVQASEIVPPPYHWDNVAIGGGGYITGLVIHPSTPDLIYARTDVGGTYRWDPQNQSWIQLMNSISYEDKNLFGIDGIAIAPNDDQVLFAAAGMYPTTTPYDVMKSTDQGATWTRTNLNKASAANGNLERSFGESIAVNPEDSNYVLVGTRRDGIWKSTNGAARADGSGTATDSNNWTQATGVPFDTEGRGVRSIVFKDSTTAYAGVIGYGVYESTDGGSSWTLMADSPVHPRRIQVSSDGNVIYVTHSEGVAKFEAGVWTNITPPTSLHLNRSSASTNYNGLTVDPANAQHLIASRRAGSVPEDIFRSTDGGASWININKSFQVNHSSPWWNPNYLAGALSSILFDPHVPGRVWMSDWLGIYRTEDVTQTKVVWSTYTKGHEEMVGFDMISPPTGAPLLAGYADNDGMLHDDLTQFPLKKFGNPALSETTALDYVEADPNYMVRVGGYSHGARGGGGSSSDGGRTWTEFPSFPTDSNGVKYPHGNVAVSATNPQHIVTLPINAPPMSSADGGQSWTVASGTPDKIKVSFWNWTQVIASDKIEGNIFYLYHAGQFYRSDDGGLNWSVVSELPAAPAYVKTAPGKSGEVWVSLNNQGLYRSTDQGESFSKLPNVQEVLLFGFGKAAPGTNTPAAYVYGKVNGSARMGIYRSDDAGATWTRINDDQHLVGGNPRDMEGDRQVYGKVYIATDGTGVWYGEPATPQEQDITAPSAPSALSVAENEDDSVTLSWLPPSDTDILHYAIYDGEQRVRLASGDATSVSIPEIETGKTYNFHIVARDTSWLSSAASETLSFTAGSNPDPTRPVIELKAGHKIVKNPAYRLEGTISKPSQMSIEVTNDDEIIHSYHTEEYVSIFDVMVALERGTNDIRIHAVDEAGNEATSISESIVYAPDDPATNPGSYFPPIYQPVAPVKEEEFDYPDWDADLAPIGSVLHELATVVDKSPDKVTVELTANDYEQLLSEFEADFTGHKTIVLKVPIVKNASEYVLRMPMEVLTSRERKADILISTEIGRMRLPIGITLQGQASGNGTVDLSLRTLNPLTLPQEIREKTGARPAIQLQISQNGKAVKFSYTAASILVTLPYAAAEVQEGDLERVGVIFVDQTGQENQVPSGIYDPVAEIISFDVREDGIYVVILQSPAFTDLTNYEWAFHAIDQLAQSGIVQGTSPGTFSPSHLVTRADFMLMLVRALKLTGQGQEDFDDVQPSDYYYEEVRLAKSLGIITGRGDGVFAPTESITRQDMMVMAVRALQAAGKPVDGGNLTDLIDVLDLSEVAPYARKDVASLVNTGIIVGSGSGLEPHRYSTRAESAVLIYRLMERVKS